jgi:hypothetical protein
MDRRDFLAVAGSALLAPAFSGAERRLLYVASPGIRNYVEWGGKGILVYDIDAGHRLLKRIASPFDDPGGKVENIKGICACAATRRLYVSTIRRLACLDLVTEKPLWVRAYEGGCDRMSITPDGRKLYLPTLEKDDWHVVDGATGDVLAKISPKSGAHNTVVGLDGTRAYLAGLRSPKLRVVDTATDAVIREVPFGDSVRPFTVDGKGRRAYVNVNGLLGFEIGDLVEGTLICRVGVPWVKPGPVKRHGCPSHGVGLTPDEREVWVVDAHNRSVHVFDNTATPPRYVASVALFDEPGWITFTRSGDFAYPSTGEVIDPKTRRIVARFVDENGAPVQSEKVVEIAWDGDRPSANGDQFGVGRVR